jgi:hypothetical protein
MHLVSGVLSEVENNNGSADVHPVSGKHIY